MKRTLTVCVATMVAISALWSARAQEPTEEQLLADRIEAAEALVRTEQANKLAQELQNKLTPEQIELRKKIREKIPTPPMPTNRELRQIPMGLKKVSNPVADTMTLGERMALRNQIMIELMMRGETNSKTINSINKYVNELNKQKVPAGSIREWILGPSSDKSRGNGSGGGDFLYEPYNTTPFTSGQWDTFDDPLDEEYPWVTTARTLVPTNGPAAQSYPYLASGHSEIRTFIDNHVDYWGDEVRHILGLWYKLQGSASFESRRIGIDKPGTSHWWTNVPVTTSWTRFVQLIPSCPLSDGQLYFSVYISRLGSFQPWRTVLFDLDPSVQWIPYAFDPIEEDFVLEKIENMMYVRWNTMVYQEGKWYLTYATNVKGPYISASITPVVIDEVATIVFPLNTTPGQNRFYRLKHY